MPCRPVRVLHSVQNHTSLQIAGHSPGLHCRSGGTGLKSLLEGKEIEAQMLREELSSLCRRGQSRPWTVRGCSDEQKGGRLPGGEGPVNDLTGLWRLHILGKTLTSSFPGHQLRSQVISSSPQLPGGRCGNLRDTSFLLPLVQQHTGNPDSAKSFNSSFTALKTIICSQVQHWAQTQMCGYNCEQDFDKKDNNIHNGRQCC
ncbi:uncharacterized protein LOC104851867 [Fukomys damarensis]|uniref:uncharacterized protein LOC104851867 n=1 Tax=Fukomys damarensis TaxID=885580 RepID=UPI00053F8EC3|nr:uncharacterized protein LOC104851867 [Fukomys damarensis]